MDSPNQLMSVFNKYLVSLDWDYDREVLTSSDSWADRSFPVNLIAALPNNQKTLMFSKSTGLLYLYTK